MGQKKLKICPLESTFIVDFKNVLHDHVPLEVFLPNVLPKIVFESIDDTLLYNTTF